MPRKLLPSSKLHYFPNVHSRNHRVTSEETVGKKVIYNCVGWAVLADTTKWWEAGGGPDYYWPTGVLDDGSLKSYQELFEYFGYRPCGDAGLEIRYEKVALYSDAFGFTHVAYQLFFGWTSKLGGWEDIRHASLLALDGAYYGTATIIMKRRSGLRGYLARACFNLTAAMWPLKRPI
jgi:hypothetical protein